MKYAMMMICFVGFGYINLNAQDKANNIKTLLDSKHYSFVPLTITTGGGHLKQLTPDYFFTLDGDTLKSYLPYFGRAYSAPMNSSDAGFDFTTTDFIYSISPGKKNSYVVTIKTKGKVYNTDFVLTIYDNGSAYLTANAIDKQQVSYNGNIK